ncbi:MAG: ABC transporter substrate-binding protein [Candidatus Peribacteraceae bacterium]
MYRLIRLLRTMTPWERWVLLALTLLFAASLVGLLRVFYLENTVLVPKTGGTYIEGSVGDLQPLNPWFTVRNDVNRDILSLVFSGLLRYNPQTRKIEDDLATVQVSGDGKTYTVRLKDGVMWHDSTEKDPHPVTADDVVFTFTSLQDPAFTNPLLQQNFRGVKVEKMDASTVRFRLDEPYSFFPSNLTLGLLPQRSFEGIPAGKLELATDFGFKPVGAGPYRVKNIVETSLSIEVTLERFDRVIPPPYRLDRIVFRIFPDYASLLSDLRNLQGVRLVPRNAQGDPMIPKRFRARTYALPQYVALFFNLDRKNLQDDKLRLGLQLGTDKQALVEKIHQSVIVDTPLLELDLKDWRYHFDSVAAQGALFASQWRLPEKDRLQRLLEQNEANNTGVLHVSPVIRLDTGAVLTLTGAIADAGDGYRLNGVLLARSPTASGAWVAVLPTAHGTGSISFGSNLLRLTNPKGRIVDSAYVFRVKSSAENARAQEEQRVLQLFLKTRAGTAAEGQIVGTQDLFLDQGMLRLRTPKDPVNIRRNDAGEELTLRLLTSNAPAEYRNVAEIIRSEWASLGVRVVIDIPENSQEFQDKLLKRDYDVVLFGQSLLDNLDSFPYWHSSGKQKLTGDAKDLRQDAYNLSQYASFKADALLEAVRRTTDEKERAQSLSELREVLKADVPAVFLYSPLYTFASRQDILGIELGSLSLHSDRFLTLNKWYVKQERVFKPGRGWRSLVSWIPSLFGSAGAKK